LAADVLPGQRSGDAYSVLISKMFRPYTLALALSLAALVLVSCVTTPSGRISLPSQLTPERPRSEYLENPLGLDALHPRLSWVVTSARRGARQTAYRILAAASEASLESGRGDLWDSGKVASDRTAQVLYAGPPLASGQRVWWMVRVWDQDDRPSAWSPSAWWEMGLLSPADPPSALGSGPADWHGRWIARMTDINARPTPLFRRVFTLDGRVKRARAYISGLGYYELHLNGRRVGDHLLDPGYTRYDRRVLHVTYDVTDQLRRGTNAIGVMLGHGWFNVQTKAPWGFDQAPWRATPRLLMELRVELTDGRTVTIATDDRWKTSDSPITFSSIYGGEDYDARLEQPGWDTAAFDDRAWQPALIVDAPKGRLVAQAMEPIKIDQVLKPVAVTEPAPGVFVFDVGQNLTGNAELKISGPAGTQVTMRYSEKLAGNGRADQANIAVHVLRFGSDQQFQTDRYTLKGRGVERWHSRFNYNGFRYVEVTGAPGRLTADNLRIYFFHSAVPLAGSFECSNPLLNQIWTNGHWSYLSNLFGIPTDCPHREKNGWTGDAQIACEQGLFYADGITVYQKWINDVGDEQKPTGALPGIVPTNGEWGYGFGSGPGWDSAFLLVPWYLYEYYGDASILEQHYDGYRRYVDYLTSRATYGSPEASPQLTHLGQIGLGDWSPWKTRTPEAVTDTGYYYRDARIVAAVARMLGKDEEAGKYDALADEIRAAFNRQFYHPESGSYSIGSQTALGCALYQGLVEPQNEPRVLDNLVATIAADSGHLDFGFLGAKYVLNTLTDHGRPDVAYTIVDQKTKPGWGWQVEQGATTLWENWNGGASQNHTFWGDVNAWMIKTLAGINPDPAAPGFRHILIQPNPVGDLTWARAAYDSIHGRIASEWTLQHGVFRLIVSIPANCTATVWLPAHDPAKIRESRRPLAKSGDVAFRRVENGRAIIDVASGDYTFVVQP
jgi:alpha-L-rhamnosidase